MSVTELYRAALADETSDVREFLEGFVALEPETVIELGVRTGNSTVAWLAAVEGRGHLWSVDVAPPLRFELEHPDWTFILGDDCDERVLAQLPRDVDLVFVDTSHDYWRTLLELECYVTRVRPGGRVLLHDTELEWPETAGPGPPFPVRRAIEVYCESTGRHVEFDARGYGLATIAC